MVDINWRIVWLLPHKYCISNKTKEVHFKILHEIYPANCFIAKFADLDVSYTFCNCNEETIPHLFFHCEMSQKFLALPTLFFPSAICYDSNPQNHTLEYLINFVILDATFFIHKHKFAKSPPKIAPFLLELISLLKSLKLRQRV